MAVRKVTETSIGKTLLTLKSYGSFITFGSIYIYILQPIQSIQPIGYIVREGVCILHMYVYIYSTRARRHRLLLYTQVHTVGTINYLVGTGTKLNNEKKKKKKKRTCVE